MVTQKMISRRSLFLIFCGAAVLGLSGWWLWHERACEGIATYKDSRDRATVLKLVYDNWYWLINEKSTFSPEYFLTHKAPTKELKDRGTSRIFVYCADNKPVGFVAWNPLSFYKGRLHLIAVEKAYRRKGISTKLMDAATEDMKQHGISEVTLITRTNNEPAKRLYKRLKYEEYWHDDDFVRYKKSL